MRTRRLRFAAFAVIAAALGLLGTAGASAHVFHSTAPVNIRFQLSFYPNPQHTGFLVADSRGYYKQAGVNVKTLAGGPTVEPTLLLAQGNVDIAQVDFSEFVEAVEKGAPMTYVGMVYQQDPLKYVALKKTPLSTPSDLKGLVIGQQQAGDIEPELKEFLAKGGLSLSDVKIKQIGFDVSPLTKGDCQVFPARVYAHAAEFQDAGIAWPSGLNVLDPNKFGLALPSQGIAVNNTFLKKHPQAVVAFLKGALRGWNAAIKNPASVVKDVQKYIPAGSQPLADTLEDIKVTIPLVNRKANGKPYPNILAINKSFLFYGQQLLHRYGVLPKKLPDKVLAKYFNTTLLEQARAQLK